MTSTPRPVALLTGCSSGIGLESALAFAEAGYLAVATCRDPARAAELAERAAATTGEVDVRRLDVTDDVAARALVASVLADHGAIDVLVNNAGAGHLATLEQLDLDRLAEALAVNFFGVARLTKLVLPKMRERASGRIVTVTSVGGVVGQPFNDAYCAAKFATEGLLESLAPVAARHGVHVSIVEPGPVATEFVNSVASSLDPAILAEDDPYLPELERYLDRSASTFAVAQQAAEVAAVVLAAATDEPPRLRYQTSNAGTAFVAAKLADVDGSRVLAETTSWIS